MATKEEALGRKQEYVVRLSPSEREHLKNLVSRGVEQARKLTHARILLKAAEGWLDSEIAQALDVGIATVGRVRKRYAAEGLACALHRKAAARAYARKLDGEAEAHLIALVCSEPPTGHAAWTLRLLAERLVSLEQVAVASVSHETVRQVLKKTNSSPGKSNNG